MRIISLLVTVITLSVSGYARPSVAILNAQRAILSTAVGKTAAIELRRKFAPEETRLSEEQQEIQNLESQLQNGAAGTDQETRSLKARLVTLTTNHRRAMEDARQKLEEERARVLNDLAAKLLLVVDQYAKKKHLHVVLDESDPKTIVYWRAKAVDITDEVIKLYDGAPRKH